MRRAQGKRKQYHRPENGGFTVGQALAVLLILAVLAGAAALNGKPVFDAAREAYLENVQAGLDARNERLARVFAVRAANMTPDGVESLSFGAPLCAFAKCGGDYKCFQYVDAPSAAFSAQTRKLWDFP